MRSISAVVLSSLVLQLLHPAADSHLYHLQTGSVNLLYQAENCGENVGVLKVVDVGQSGNVELGNPLTLFLGPTG